MTAIRPAAVAGLFYPDQPQTLVKEVRGLLSATRPPRGKSPKAIIAPHAGYQYSGAVAGRVYARLMAGAARIRRVVLIGPCHRVAVRGVAVPSAEAFETPLGRVALDRDALDDLLKLPQVQVFDDTHTNEHSLEVHLPFLQAMLRNFTLVPLVAGDATTEEIAEVLDAVWGGEETLIVVSSDLSHFLDYEAAQAIDSETCRAIETLEPDAIGRDNACGRVPVRGLLETAKRRGMTVETVDVRNSGDTAGPRDRVVGYGAWAFIEPDTQLSPASDTDADVAPEPDPDVSPMAEPRAAADNGATSLLRRHGGSLLRIAAASIVDGVDGRTPGDLDLNDLPLELADQGASFVTLRAAGQLRGCIGSAEAHLPLVQDVAENAYRAAFRDPRFPPLEAHEMPGLSLSISILSPPETMAVTRREDLLTQLRPGVDGLIIEDQGHRALFLPSVWAKLPDKEAFVSHLMQKAGLAPDHWSPTVVVSRFQTAEIGQDDLTDPSTIWS